MKISVIAPVKNEAEFIGYSAMSVLPHVHEVIYGLADSTDGTEDVLDAVKQMDYGRLEVLKSPHFNFDIRDQSAYQKAFNILIDYASGDVIWYLHPDMIVLNGEVVEKMKEGPLAWFVNLRSFSGDKTIEITSGRTKVWKTLHAKKFGLQYWGHYGSKAEDFYHRDITYDSHEHYGDQFNLYPYSVADSGIHLHHYCEAKTYSERLKKMTKCIEAQYPGTDPMRISEMARQHPRVTLKPSSRFFGAFEFKQSQDGLLPIFDQYKEEFTVRPKEIANV